MDCYRSAKAVHRGSAGAVRETFGSDLICPFFRYKSRWIVSPSCSIRQSRYLANPGLHHAESDGRGNACDNCSLAANNGEINTGPAQNDADQDGYGNLCDADLNNSGTVTTADFGLLRSVLNLSALFSLTAAALWARMCGQRAISVTVRSDVE